jgi:hypothetical protein
MCIYVCVCVLSVPPLVSFSNASCMYVYRYICIYVLERNLPPVHDTHAHDYIYKSHILKLLRQPALSPSELFLGNVFPRATADGCCVNGFIASSPPPLWPPGLQARALVGLVGRAPAGLEGLPARALAGLVGLAGRALAGLAGLCACVRPPADSTLRWCCRPAGQNSCRLPPFTSRLSGIRIGLAARMVMCACACDDESALPARCSGVSMTSRDTPPLPGYALARSEGDDNSARSSDNSDEFLLYLGELGGPVCALADKRALADCGRECGCSWCLGRGRLLL